MQRHELSWASDALGTDARVWRFGDAGKPVILFPTTSGGCNEVVDFGLVKTAEALIGAGRTRIYTVGCPLAAVWMDRSKDGPSKTAALEAWARFVSEELVPRVTDDVGSDVKLAAAGVNVGAHNAVNAVARHPDVFDLAIGMSGTYDFDGWMNGHFDSAYYFNQPIRFVPNLEGDALAAVQQALFVLATGSGRWEDPEQTRRLAGVLRGKAVPVSLEVWGNDALHDWPTWRTMFPLFLERSV